MACLSSEVHNRGNLAPNRRWRLRVHGDIVDSTFAKSRAIQVLKTTGDPSRLRKPPSVAPQREVPRSSGRAPAASSPSSRGDEEPAATAAMGVPAASARHLVATGDGRESTVACKTVVPARLRRSYCRHSCRLPGLRVTPGGRDVNYP